MHVMHAMANDKPTQNFLVSDSHTTTTFTYPRKAIQQVRSLNISRVRFRLREGEVQEGDPKGKQTIYSSISCV